MKTHTLTWVIITLLIGLVLGLLHGYTIRKRLYPNALYVAETNKEENYVAAVSITGNAFKFSGVDDWMIGDVVAVIMDDKGTENVDDDVIIKKRYAGNLGLKESEYGNVRKEK